MPAGHELPTFRGLLASLRAGVFVNLLRGSSVIALVALILSPSMIAANLTGATLLGMYWLTSIAISWRIYGAGHTRAAAVIFVAATWLTFMVPTVFSPLRCYGGSVVATLAVTALVLPRLWAIVVALGTGAIVVAAVSFDSTAYALPVFFHSSCIILMTATSLVIGLVFIVLRLSAKEIRLAFVTGIHEARERWEGERAQSERQEKSRTLHAEAKADESERRYRSLFDSAMDCILVIDRNGLLVDLNHKVSATLGYSREELLGTSLSRVLNSQLTERMYPRPAEILIEQRSVRGEQELRAKDGSTRFVEFIASPLPDGNVLAVVRDVTERRQAADAIKALNEALEQRVAEQTAELRQANHELESFSYTVSHDLRAPLRRINGFAAVIRSNHGDALAGEPMVYLERIEQNAIRMERLIDDLLKFASAAGGTLACTTIDMRPIVDTIIEDHASQWGRHAKFEIGKLPPVTGDPSLLRLVWCNLVDNAVKYSSKVAQPRIAIGATATGEMVEFWVKDNGAGFDMAYADKLFDVFQRLHSASEFEGSGIGLATVQRIVHRHGGALRAHGRSGEGATIFFTLPAAKRRESAVP
jgi:PAS domain S-box-containing protein